MASLATSTKSKLALKLEPPPPLRVIKTPRVEDTSFCSSPLSRPSPGQRVLQERSSMTSFRDESNLEEGHIDKAVQDPQRESLESSATDETSESLKYALSPLLERDSTQPQFRGRSSDRTQIEQIPLTRDGTPQPGTVKAAIASLNALKTSTSADRLSPQDDLALLARTRPTSAQPQRLSATKSQSEKCVGDPVSPAHTTQNSSQLQQLSASKPQPENYLDNPTIADTCDSGSVLNRAVTPDQGDLSVVYRRKSEYGTATILASPTTTSGNPTLVASVLPLQASKSQVTISKPLNPPTSSISSSSEPTLLAGDSGSNHPDTASLSDKFQDLTTSLIRAPIPIVEVVNQSPYPPSQRNSSPTDTEPQNTFPGSPGNLLPSPPPTKPLPIPHPKPIAPFVIDESLLAAAAQTCRIAAQTLAYDLIYAVSIFAPKHDSANPSITPDDVQIRLLVAHGMQCAPTLNAELHFAALRSLGIYLWTPLTHPPLEPEDFSIGRFEAIPSHFGSSRIRNSGIVVAAFRRSSTSPIASETVELQYFHDFVGKFKAAISQSPKFKSRIPQRMASSPALREKAAAEETGFPANEAVEVRTATPSPMTTPEMAGILKPRGPASKQSLANGRTASSMGKRSGLPTRRNAS